MIDVFNLKDSKVVMQQENNQDNNKIYVGLEREIHLKKQELQQLANVFNNIKASERLRCKINKDFIAGVDHEEILKDCLKCISLMTGDTVFYRQNAEYVEKAKL